MKTCTRKTRTGRPCKRAAMSGFSTCLSHTYKPELRAGLLHRLDSLSTRLTMAVHLNYLGLGLLWRADREEIRRLRSWVEQGCDRRALGIFNGWSHERKHLDSYQTGTLLRRLAELERG